MFPSCLGIDTGWGASSVFLIVFSYGTLPTILAAMPIRELGARCSGGCRCLDSESL